MKKVKFYLDYKCFPIWVYDENDALWGNDLPVELSHDKKIDELLVNIQEEYDNLFVDSEIEFYYKGFADENEKNNFKLRIENIVSEFETKIGNKYIIENAMEIE